MLQLPETVVLRNLIDNTDCDARIVPITREMAQRKIDGQWWQIGGSRTKRREEGDHDWNWTKIFGENRGALHREMVAVVTADAAVQGAITYWTNGKSLLDSELGSVYVQFIATAPRNRPWLVDKPFFQGVGYQLLLYAVCHSYILGLGGRVTLVSLPTEKTKEFYTNRGFTKISEDENGNMEFELMTADAERWLREEGLIP
jgi:hypothetical protein